MDFLFEDPETARTKVTGSDGLGLIFSNSWLSPIEISQSAGCCIWYLLTLQVCDIGTRTSQN